MPLLKLRYFGTKFWMVLKVFALSFPVMLVFGYWNGVSLSEEVVEADTPIPFHDSQFARQTKTQNICRLFGKDDLLSWWNDGITLQYLSKNISYCFIPKVGCTFWKRIFRILDTSSAAGEINPDLAAMKRFDVHNAAWKTVKVRLMRNRIDRELVSSNYAFMFARDPYSRLWSAYVDKLFLPGFWNNGLARSVVLKRGYFKKDDKLCTSDISFSEFLNEVVNDVLERKNFNRHWYPIFRLCNPCQIKFDFIGKLETFSLDSMTILRMIGLEALAPVTNFADHVYDEIRILTEDNFKKYRLCLNIEERARRLWKTFQINGYLSEDSNIDGKITPYMNETSLLKIVFEELEKRPVTKDIWVTRRNKVMTNAFRSIPNEIIENVQAVFDLDFRLFGYNKRPDFIYKSRSIK